MRSLLLPTLVFLFTLSFQTPATNNYQEGKLHWVGLVDDEVHLIIRGNIVQTKTVSGAANEDYVYRFFSPLPEAEAQVSVKKNDGRGSAKVIQQPNSGNNFTAIVQILDKNGGAKDYDLEIRWK